MKSEGARLAHRTSLPLVGIVVLCVAQLGWGDDLQNRYFQGLRDRGLYLIAEDYAVSRLSTDLLLPDERAIVTIELVRTLTAHGGVSSPEQRDELWNEAERLLKQFSESHKNNPRLLEIQAEQALLPARFGDELAWELQINPVNQKLATATRDEFSKAIQKIGNVLVEFDKAPEKPSPSDLADGALTQAERVDLRQQLEFYLVRSKFFLAQTAPPGPDRTGLFLDVADEFDALSKNRPESKWTFKARKFLATLARDRGDYSRADSLLRSLARNAAEYSMQDEILAEQVRSQYDQGKLDDGLRMITDQIQSGHPLGDEVRSVAVEGLLKAWKIAGEKGQADFQKELLAEAESHHQRTRGKWQKLTYAKLSQVQQNLNLGDELATLVRQAQWNYHNGDLKQAIQFFQNAAALAHRQGKSDNAIDYAFTVGSIQIQQEDWPAAAKTFEDIVTNFPDAQKSQDAGLMKCYVLGRIYLQRPLQETRIAYEAALSKQRVQFPNTPSAIEATWMLAVHNEQRLQWTDAIDLYREIPADHPRYDTATLRIVILYEKILTRLKELNGPVEVWEDQLLEEIVRIEDHLPNHNVLDSMEQCQTALRIAQLLLQHRDRWYSVADHWLKRIEQTVEAQQREAALRNAKLDPLWTQIQRATSQLRIVSLAGQQRLGDARKIMLQLEQTDPSTMLGILLGLTEMTSKIDPLRQVEMGHLQLEAINRLEQSRSELTPQQQRMLDDSHAEAFIAIGNLKEAAEIYAKLIESTPRNERLLRKVIAVLLKRGKAEDLLEARDWWKRIEQLHKPGEADWVEARLEIAKIDVRVGEKEQALKLLGVTKTLYPQLGTPTLREEFDRFLEELKSQ
ncbi:tetratricopeptide repeat protein [Thalassoglobus sp.]|uniref:tetratricopeptide repeat protein n=1 Tax=Thalassoglobus sp. TaxID=2795869 RepID=UPI003AA8BA51